jgi:hypothetical protein
VESGPHGDSGHGTERSHHKHDYRYSGDSIASINSESIDMDTLEEMKQRKERMKTNYETAVQTLNAIRLSVVKHFFCFSGPKVPIGRRS